MPISVQAAVVDIRSDHPKEGDAFFVDTNVWYWMTYTRASQSTRPPAPYQTTHYPVYTNAALYAGAKIFQSGLTLAELTHLIERAEYQIFAQANPARYPDPNKFEKMFRHSETERTQVMLEIQAAWSQIATLGDFLTFTIDETATNAALNRCDCEKVDGYDLFFLECMKNHGVVQVITDDTDFLTVAGIQVYTANNIAIKAARSQNKLITR